MLLPDGQCGGIVPAQFRAQAVVQCDDPAASRHRRIRHGSGIVDRGAAIRLIADPDRPPAG